MKQTVKIVSKLLASSNLEESLQDPIPMTTFLKLLNHNPWQTSNQPLNAIPPFQTTQKQHQLKASIKIPGNRSHNLTSADLPVSKEKKSEKKIKINEHVL
jgi:hypothetical protein